MNNNKQRTVYLDAAATTKPDRKVVNAMSKVTSDFFGNTESMHHIGHMASIHLDSTRAKIAKCFLCDPDEIVFTSGGTEGNNWIMRGVAMLSVYEPINIITTSYEHSSIINTLKILEKEFPNLSVTYINPNVTGHIDPNEVLKAVKPSTKLISIMAVNNETGACQLPALRKIYKVLQQAKSKIWVHTDAVQFACYDQIIQEHCYDFLTLSSHKFYGPKGSGILYIKKNHMTLLSQNTAGAQEFGLRGGTVNLPGAVGTAVALQHNLKSFEHRFDYDNPVARIYHYFVGRLSAVNKDIVIHDTDIPNIVSVDFSKVTSLPMATELASFGVCVSTGAACDGGDSEDNYSHVLKALGYTLEMAKGTVRFSFDKRVTRADIDYTINCIKSIIK